MEKNCDNVTTFLAGFADVYSAGDVYLADDATLSGSGLSLAPLTLSASLAQRCVISDESLSNLVASIARDPSILHSLLLASQEHSANIELAGLFH